MAKELAWLEQKTNVFENPAEKRLEELKWICINQGINNPIIGEDLYNPNLPDPTKQTLEFKNKIRKQANDPDIFRDYKRDRRDVMGECLMKGEAYENDRKEKQELLMTTMKHYIWGEKSLSKKEKSLLKFHGVISPEKQRVVVVEDGEVFFEGDPAHLASMENSTKGSRARISETNES